MEPIKEKFEFRIRASTACILALLMGALVGIFLGAAYKVFMWVTQ